MDFPTKPSATETFDKIKADLAAGKTVTVSTSMRVTVITPKTAKKWDKNGHILFKIIGSSLYMARGNNFDCIDFCAIAAQ